MDDPNPLLTLSFLASPHLLTKSNPDTLARENALLDDLCLIALLPHCPPLADEFTDRALTVAEDLTKADQIKQFWVDLRVHTRMHLVANRLKRALPVLTSTKDDAGIVAAVSRFETEYAQRLLPQWTNDDNDNKKLTLRVFQLLPTVLCQQLVVRDLMSATTRALIIESLVFQHYLTIKYASLHPDKKNDPAQPAVRLMFWAMSFLTSARIDPPPTPAARQTLFAQVRDCLLRTERTAQKLVRLEQLRVPPEEARILQPFLQEMRREQPNRLHQPATIIEQNAIMALKTDLLCRLCENDDFPNVVVANKNKSDGGSGKKKKKPAAVVINDAPAARGSSVNIDAMLPSLESGEHLFLLPPPPPPEEEDVRLQMSLLLFNDDDDDNAQKEEAAAIAAAAAAAIQRSKKEEELAAAAAAEAAQRIEEELLQQAIAEAQADRDAEARVLARLTTASPDFKRALLAHFVPEFATGEEDQECFICFEALDYNDPQQLDRIRFLTCCRGGGFACGRCVDGHANHPVQGERRIVTLKATMRRSFGF